MGVPLLERLGGAERGRRRPDEFVRRQGHLVLGPERHDAVLAVHLQPRVQRRAERELDAGLLVLAAEERVDAVGLQHVARLHRLVPGAVLREVMVVLVDLVLDVLGELGVDVLRALDGQLEVVRPRPQDVTGGAVELVQDLPALDFRQAVAARLVDVL